MQLAAPALLSQLQPLSCGIQHWYTAKLRATSPSPEQSVICALHECCMGEHVYGRSPIMPLDCFSEGGSREVIELICADCLFWNITCAQQPSPSRQLWLRRSELASLMMTEVIARLYVQHQKEVQVTFLPFKGTSYLMTGSLQCKSAHFCT